MNTVATSLTTCANCAATLEGPYCAQCGQKAAPLNPSLHEVFQDLLHEFAHVDGKIVTSIALLLIKPGYLTKEYFDGRRIRYVTPLRLYVIFSVLYFGVAAFAPLGGPRIRCTSCPPDVRPQIEEAMYEAYTHWTPRAMFLLVPIFGGLIALVARKARRSYPLHLYFAMHVHAACFFAATVGCITTALAIPYVSATLNVAAATYGSLYPSIAFRRAYAGTALTSVWLALVIGFYIAAVMVAVILIVLPIALRG